MQLAVDTGQQVGFRLFVPARDTLQESGHIRGCHVGHPLYIGPKPGHCEPCPFPRPSRQ